MKKLTYILVVIAAFAAIAFTLMNNKKEMAANAAVAEIKSDAISVALAQVKAERIDKSFQAQGNFKPIQSLVLLSETQGQIKQVHKRKGDRVQAGDLLVQVEANTVHADLSALQANYEKAKRDLSRFENLAAGEAITKRQLEEVRLGVKAIEAQLVAARQRVNKSRVTAPISGEINEIYVEIGSYLTMGTRLYDIVNVDRLKLNVKVNEREVLLIRKGDQVTVQADVNAADTFPGTVTAIAAQADNSMKYDVEIEVKNPNQNSLRAGMYGTASFAVADQRETLLIPREAIVGSLQDPAVYTVEQGIARLKKVKIGTVTQDQVEIVSGLSAGQQVVQSGQINLQDGLQVKAL